MTKVPFDAKKYFFSYSPVPFQNYSFATLLSSWNIHMFDSLRTEVIIFWA